MTNKCRRPQDCPCSRRARIIASNNAVGPAICFHVPGARPTPPSAPESIYGYPAANDEKDPLGMAFRDAVAEIEGVRANEVRITGSLLEWFERLPRYLERRNIIKVRGDFVGYGRGAADDIPLTEIPIPIDADFVDPETVANAVQGKEKPIVFQTFPTTNPGQTKMSLDIPRAILSSNKDAIIVIDNAYGAYGDVSGLASFALSNDRTIYVQTASKDLLLCGARMGWCVASPSLQARLARSILPYPVSPTSLEQAYRLLQMPDVLHAMRHKQARSRDILAEGLRTLGVRLRTGAGPWILIELGDPSNAIVEELSSQHKIEVQAQAGCLAGWVRISATVPCQAQIIVSVMIGMMTRHCGNKAAKPRPT